MDLNYAIEILKYHNEWRRDNDSTEPMINPTLLGEAIDTVVNELVNR